MAAIYDAHPWLSQYELWAILTGREAPPDLSAKEEVYWGTRLEEIVIDEYEKRTGREVTRENREIRHPAIEIMGGEVDGWILASTNAPIGTGILDAKTTNAFSAKDWESGPPRYYKIQIQHYLACTGLLWGSVAVLIGGQRFRWCDIKRNDRFIADLERRCQEWWQEHIVRDEPPPVDGSESTGRALKALFPADDGSEVVLSHDICQAAEQLELLQEQLRQTKEEIEGLENQIIEEMGPASLGILPDGSGWFSYKLSNRKAYQVKECSYRTLRRGGKK